MYLKNRKFQVGGVVYTPFLPAQAGSPQQTTSTGSSTSSSSEKISGTMKKEVIDMLKENGIPSDVDSFLTQAQSFLNKSTHLSSSLFGDSDDYDLSDLIQLQSLANRVKFNKALYDNATKQLTEQFAWSEVAIDNRGLMYAYGEDGMTKINPSEYYKNPEKYQLLTNSDILTYRENYKPFDNTTLNELQDAVGMKTITKYLQDTIKSFGKTSVEGYATKDRDSILNGFHYLLMDGPDGYYKVKSEDQLRDVNRALSYLYNSLPQNMRQFLRAKTAAEGGNPDGKDRYKLIGQALSEHTSSTYTANFDKSASDYEDEKLSGKGKGSGSSEQLTQDNYLQQIGTKRLYRTQAAIAPAASQVYETGMMIVPAYSAGAPVDRQRDVLGKMSLSQFRQRAEATQAGNFNEVTFGNKVIGENEYDKLMYDGSSEINIVALPYTRDPATGKMTPDFSYLAKFNRVQKYINEHRNTTETERMQVATREGLNYGSVKYDAKENKLIIRDTMDFITFSCIVGSDAFKQIDKEMKPFLEHYNNRTAKDLLKSYNNAINYGNVSPGKNASKINSFNTPERWDLYKGNVFIPMENAARALLHSGIGEYVPKSSMTDFAQRVSAREQEAALQMYLQENDPNYDTIVQNIGKFR